MTNQPLLSTLEDNRFNRFDDELIDTYFNEAGKQAIRDYIANQVKANTPTTTDDELDEILLQYWRAARLRNNTTSPEEYHSKAKQAILAHQEQAVREARIDENRKAYAEVSKRYRGFHTRSGYQSVKYKSEGVGIMLKTGQAQKLLDMRLAELTSKESE